MHGVSAHSNSEWLVTGSIRLSMLKRALKVLHGTSRVVSVRGNPVGGFRLTSIQSFRKQGYATSRDIAASSLSHDVFYHIITIPIE